MTSILNNRIEVMHGVNLDQLGRRDPAHYGDLDLPALERQIEAWASEMGLSVRFFQTNHEGDFVEHLHELRDLADAIILNPGAWTHYSWAIRRRARAHGPAGHRGAPLSRERTRAVAPAVRRR